MSAAAGLPGEQRDALLGALWFEESYAAAITALAAHLAAGFIVTIDYGDTTWNLVQGARRGELPFRVYGAPTDFVPLKWRPYMVDPAKRIDRHYYELCTLWELRGALRAGNVWVSGSRLYANPETVGDHRG
jgi:hypothetical protein